LFGFLCIELVNFLLNPLNLFFEGILGNSLALDTFKLDLWVDGSIPDLDVYAGSEEHSSVAVETSG
jgi:hypothetical protein